MKELEMRLSVICLHYWITFQVKDLMVAASYLCSPVIQSVPEGGNATFCCSSRSNDSIILWIDDDTPFLVNRQFVAKAERYQRYIVTEAGNFTIVGVQQVDNGNFTCQANFSKTTATLIVELPPGPPVISTSKKNPKEGDRLVVTCTTSGGVPSPTFILTKNGQNVTANATAWNPSSKVSSATLILILSYRDNKAVLSCTVFNKINLKNPLVNTTLLNVRYSPRITVRKSPYKVKAGTTATLNCSVDANPPPEFGKIWWQKGATPLVSTNVQALPKIFYEMPTVTPSSAGDYVCVAVNDIGGQQQKIVSVSVLYKPQVIVDPKVVVNESSSVTLNCSANANPPATSHWITSKGEQPGPVLSFVSITPQEAGNYTCIARNVLDPDDGNREQTQGRNITELLVRYPPGPAHTDPYAEAIKGESLRLTCDVDNPGYPEAFFEWRRGNRKDSQVLSTMKQYVIKNVLLSHSGIYSCTPKNLMGAGENKSVIVTVNELPEFIAVLTNNTINVIDKSFSITCSAHGKPPPVIRWLKDGQPVSANFYKPQVNQPQPYLNHTFKQYSTLLFEGRGRHPEKKLRRADAGSYTCVLTSKAKENYSKISTMHLLVNYAPHLIATQKIVAINMGQPANLTIDTQAHPSPTFTWSKNNSPMMSGQKWNITNHPLPEHFWIRSSLLIFNPQKSDLGTYKCRINNSFGSEFGFIILKEKSKPDSPEQLKVIEKTWESVYLSWKPGFNGGYKQTFVLMIFNSIKNHTLEVNNSADPIFYNLTELMPKMNYSIAVQGKNVLGLGKVAAISAVSADLKLPLPESVEYSVEKKMVNFEFASNLSCCARVDVAKTDEKQWEKFVGCAGLETSKNSIELNSDAKFVNVSLCLQRRPEVCGDAVTAKKLEPDGLTTAHVIAIGVVCSVIVLILLIVLVVFLYLRRQSNKKIYGNEVSHHPHYSNGSIPNGKSGKHAYDNPGMVPVDNVDGDIPHRKEAYLPEKHSSMFNIYDYHNGYTSKHNTSSEPADELPPYTEGDIDKELSDESDLEKQLENDLPQNDSLSSDPQSYHGPPTKPKDLSFNGFPRPQARSPYFINLHPEHVLRENSASGRESGYSTPDPARPKKVIYEVIV